MQFDGAARSEDGASFELGDATAQFSASRSPHASLLRTQRTLLASLEHVTQERDELQASLQRLRAGGGTQPVRARPQAHP